MIKIKKNIGFTDKIVRFVIIDLCLGASYLGTDLPAQWATAAFLLSLILIISLFSSYSLIYQMLGISTLDLPKEHKPTHELDGGFRKESITSSHKDCYHCGDNCGQSALIFEDKSFCCSGCKMVYTILSENGLSNFYKLNENAGLSQKEYKTNLQYDYLDNESTKTETY